MCVTVKKTRDKTRVKSFYLTWFYAGFLWTREAYNSSCKTVVVVVVDLELFCLLQRKAQDCFQRSNALPPESLYFNFEQKA